MKFIGFNEYGDGKVLEMMEGDKPTPGKNQVLIKTVGVSINYADIMTRRGSYHAAKATFPITLGLDVMGTVEAVDEGSSKFKKGDRVVAFPKEGSYAEYVLADENLTFKVPEEIEEDQAIACPLVAVTSYVLIHKVARLQPGETILIQAASGGIGTTAIQIAKEAGAKKIIGTVGSEGKRSLPLEFGADEVFISGDPDLADKVQAYTENAGVDVILDSLGGDYTRAGMKYLAPFGRLVTFGSASGGYSDINTGELHATCRSVLGFSSGTARNLRPHILQEAMEDVFKLMKNKKLNMKIWRSFAFEEIGEAQELMETSRSTGKIIVKWK